MSTRGNDQRADKILEVRRRAVRFVLATSTRDNDPPADKILKSGQDASSNSQNARADTILETGERRTGARTETACPRAPAL